MLERKLNERSTKKNSSQNDKHIFKEILIKQKRKRDLLIKSSIKISQIFEKSFRAYKYKDSTFRRIVLKHLNKRITKVFHPCSFNSPLYDV